MKLAYMTNPGPLPAKYTWYFINRPPVVRGKDLSDEGVDMESDYDSPEEEIPHGGKWEVEEEEEDDEEEEVGDVQEEEEEEEEEVGDVQEEEEEEVGDVQEEEKDQEDDKMEREERQLVVQDMEEEPLKVRVDPQPTGELQSSGFGEGTSTFSRTNPTTLGSFDYGPTSVPPSIVAPKDSKANSEESDLLKNENIPTIAQDVVVSAQGAQGSTEPTRDSTPQTRNSIPQTRASIPQTRASILVLPFHKLVLPFHKLVVSFQKLVTPFQKLVVPFRRALHPRQPQALLLPEVLR